MIATLVTDKKRLMRVLRQCRDDLELSGCSFTKESFSKLCYDLNALYGEYLHPSFTPDSRTVVKQLRFVEKAARQLSNLTLVKEGFTDRACENSEVTSRIVKFLSLNPEIIEAVGAKDTDDLLNYVRESAKNVSLIGLAAGLAAEELCQAPARPGRPKTTWYTSYTRLLLKLCDEHEVNPTLFVSRTKQKEGPDGNLFRIATHFERVLPRELRIGSDETRFDRLKRAKTVTKETLEVVGLSDSKATSWVPGLQK